ncbi:hypothetical protein HDU93_008386 [Gonapodya sp. JEL0774]|nr:hypothetical protein HDU93_008386 [Gonapodya sp. JEL0774]
MGRSLLTTLARIETGGSLFSAVGGSGGNGSTSPINSQTRIGGKLNGALEWDGVGRVFETPSSRLNPFAPSFVPLENPQPHIINLAVSPAKLDLCWSVFGPFPGPGSLPHQSPIPAAANTFTPERDGLLSNAVELSTDDVEFDIDPRGVVDALEEEDDDTAL